MKSSRYNYFAADDGKIICLNGVTGNVFAISEDVFPLLKDILKNPNDQIYDANLYQSLYNLHFLIDDDLDEIDCLRKRYQDSIKGSLYKLIVNPTQECNFRCWYCYENHVTGQMNNNILERVKLFIDKTIARTDINSFELSWFGGEPLLYFKEIIYPLARHAQCKAEKEGKSFWQTMTTNGYYLTPDIITFCKETRLTSVQITLDGNRELHNRTRNEQGKPSFDRILENIINFCRSNIENEVILRINYTKEVIEAGLKEVFESIPDEVRPQIRVNFQRVWQTVGIEKTSEALMEHLKYIKELGYPLVNNTAFDIYRGKQCYADMINYANINYDGNVFRCTAKEYSPENRLGYLDANGDIVWTKQDLVRKVIESPTFENENCLKCKNLAICGGLCFNHRWNCINNSQKPECIKSKVDTDVNSFLKSYYQIHLKRREQLKQRIL